MSPCAKCGHDIGDHDFQDIDRYGHCAHHDRIGLRTVDCVCSEYKSQSPCRCDACEKYRRRYD